MHAACQRCAAHVVSVKSTKMGSLNECRRVFEICQAHGVRVHIGGSPGRAVVDVAMAQLAASLLGMDNECDVGEFQALEGDPTIEHASRMAGSSLIVSPDGA
jgi:L-alanine-DL-glutamate epimerase-like enolase superfamily enzyme